MGMFRNLADRAMVRLHQSNEYESLPLRAYFKRHHDIEVGLYSIGGFDRWRIPPGSRIGRYCSIARTARLLDADHPIDALSTHPYFYLKQFGVVGADQAHLVPPRVEDGAWIGHNAIITPGCNRIGRGAVIGAGAVVMQDVPPYAIVTGAPAKLVRFRFDPDTIAVIEASRWWTLSRAELAEAARAAPDFALHPSRATAAGFLAALGGITLPPPVVSAAPAVATRSTASPEQLRTLLKAEIPDLRDSNFATPFKDLAIDSFGLISMRIAVEQLIGGQIPDRDWGALQSPADLMALTGGSDNTSTSAITSAPAPAAPRAAPAAEAITSESAGTRPASEVRRTIINMPQMALRGLSESWLLKELGDLHWHTLCKGLNTPSSAIADSEGCRLYATFTRLLISLEAPLTDFRENEPLIMDLAPSRFGAGMFFGDVALSGATAKGRAQLMTSFSKFGEAGSNTSLMKGQPVIPDGCLIPGLSAAPDFALEYRSRRAEQLPAPLFETRYEQLPVHDINGVGLLYFAAYPMIADLCAMRHGGRQMLFDYSTTRRDICYFANTAPDDILIFRIHHWDASEDRILSRATIARESDGKTMALIDTEKKRVHLKPIR